MNTIIPSFVLIAIFIATAWGCGTLEPEPSSEASSVDTTLSAHVLEEPPKEVFATPETPYSPDRPTVS